MPSTCSSASTSRLCPRRSRESLTGSERQLSNRDLHRSEKDRGKRRSGGNKQQLSSSSRGTGFRSSPGVRPGTTSTSSTRSSSSSSSNNRHHNSSQTDRDLTLTQEGSVSNSLNNSNHNSNNSSHNSNNSNRGNSNSSHNSSNSSLNNNNNSRVSINSSNSLNNLSAQLSASPLLLTKGILPRLRLK